MTATLNTGSTTGFQFFAYLSTSPTPENINYSTANATANINASNNTGGITNITNSYFFNDNYIIKNR